jgi:hypothetical protein
MSHCISLLFLHENKTILETRKKIKEDRKAGNESLTLRLYDDSAERVKYGT